MNDPTEIVPGRIYRLGGTVALHDNVSWVPAGVRGYQPQNCYLVIEDETVTLIDTGIAAHRDLIVEQMLKVMPRDKPLTVFLTRSEYDCIGGLAAIQQHFPVAHLLAGGSVNPFDGFAGVTELEGTWDSRIQLGRNPVGGSSMVDTSKDLETITPALRLLVTFWVYDRVSKTFFSSDLFGHTVTATADAKLTLDPGDPDPTTPESLRAHMLAKFHWLAQSLPDGVPARDLKTVFADREIENIAPSHGLVLRGKEVIQRDFDRMITLLEHPWEMPA
ncbi:oxygen-binding di-iron domain-containing protein [Acuticoccus mangrovi]|uniref:MBL fold metallo-hydrolase n=1 Tax=Acuticoccus mangrovi TaxID=2796142 RepID=A0A934IS30_9HYPH|nr:MBL fold metallo-hydrolase [Acuticoccus mangrovi]MBJ3777015.1 MBL fold metallo-hydrolase [Acuticoccus mangrovi]